MELKNERDILNLIGEDEWMMNILAAARSLQLPDWWICAGFLRSKIWDTLHGFRERTTTPDIDVVYFDSTNTDESKEKDLEQKLFNINPNVPWSVKNEARMHALSYSLPYSSSEDAISKFPETATALGIKLDENDNLVLAAPHGINDIVNLKVRPTAFFTRTKERITIYEERVIRKNWKPHWNKLSVQHV